MPSHVLLLRWLSWRELLRPKGGGSSSSSWAFFECSIHVALEESETTQCPFHTIYLSVFCPQTATHFCFNTPGHLLQRYHAHESGNVWFILGCLASFHLDVWFFCFMKEKHSGACEIVALKFLFAWRWIHFSFSITPLESLTGWRDERTNRRVHRCIGPSLVTVPLKGEFFEPFGVYSESKRCRESL